MDLPIETIDPRLQHQMWRVQRLGWLLGLALILAALGGLTGSGPFSTADLDLAGGGTLRFDRFTRAGADTELAFNLPASDEERQRLLVSVNAEYLRGVQVISLEPPPGSVDLRRDGWLLHYTAGVNPGGVLKLRVAPEHAGILRGRISLNGGLPVEFVQLVYP